MKNYEDETQWFVSSYLLSVFHLCGNATQTTVYDLGWPHAAQFSFVNMQAHLQIDCHIHTWIFVYVQNSRFSRVKSMRVSLEILGYILFNWMQKTSLDEWNCNEVLRYLIKA